MASFAAEPDDGPTDDTLMQAMARMIGHPIALTQMAPRTGSDL